MCLDFLNKIFNKQEDKIEITENNKGISVNTDNINVTICNSQKEQDNNIKGYFVFARYMDLMDIVLLKSIGVNTIFLNYYALDKYGEDKVNDWINSVPFDVYIWVQCFNNGEWLHPLDIDLNDRVTELVSYDVSSSVGFLLDYLRRPGDAYQRDGTVEAINEFVKKFDSITDKKLIACVMPEKMNKYYYGQDLQNISKYVDYITAMIYKGNYKQSSDWIKDTCEWLNSECTDCGFFASLQGYVSDNDTSILSDDELRTDINNAYKGGSNGVSIFRYGLSTYVNMNQ